MCAPTALTLTSTADGRRQPRHPVPPRDDPRREKPRAKSGRVMVALILRIRDAARHAAARFAITPAETTIEDNAHRSGCRGQSAISRGVLGVPAPHFRRRRSPGQRLVNVLGTKEYGPDGTPSGRQGYVHHTEQLLIVEPCGCSRIRQCRKSVLVRHPKTLREAHDGNAGVVS